MPRRIGIVAIAVLVVALTAGSLLSQEPQPGGPPPRERDRGANWRERMQRTQEEQQQRIREILQIQSDEEWQKLQPLIQDVQRLERAQGSVIGIGRLRAAGREGERPTAAAAPADLVRRAWGEEGEPPAQLTEYATAARSLTDIQRNAASTDEEIGKAIDAYKAARQKLQALMQEKQEALRKAITPRQEAGLLLLGVL